LNQQTAEIDITGRIASGETYNDSRAGQTTKVKIKGGQIFGSCVVDRATGLPLELRRTRYLNLTVLTANGAVVEQDKRVITTIRSFPNTRGPLVDASPQRADGLRRAPTSAIRPVPAPAIQPVSGTNQGPSRSQQSATSIPSTLTNPPLTSTVRAVYPD
jgi:hypothetical protein